MTDETDIFQIRSQLGIQVTLLITPSIMNVFSGTTCYQIRYIISTGERLPDTLITTVSCCIYVSEMSHELYLTTYVVFSC